MGLKSGSRDAGLDDNGEAEPESEEKPTTERRSVAGEQGADERRVGGEASGEQAPSRRSEGTDAAPGTETENTESTKTRSQRPSMDSIPYKLRRAKVNEGREQVPYFLREEVIDAEGELQDTLEELLGESVYKSDYREAAMIVAQRNPELVADVLREWGYDLEMT